MNVRVGDFELSESVINQSNFRQNRIYSLCLHVASWHGPNLGSNHLTNQYVCSVFSMSAWLLNV